MAAGADLDYRHGGPEIPRGTGRRHQGARLLPRTWHGKQAAMRSVTSAAQNVAASFPAAERGSATRHWSYTRQLLIPGGRTV